MNSTSTTLLLWSCSCVSRESHFACNPARRCQVCGLRNWFSRSNSPSKSISPVMKISKRGYSFSKENGPRTMFMWHVSRKYLKLQLSFFKMQTEWKMLCTFLYMTVFCINVNKIFWTVTVLEFLTASGTCDWTTCGVPPFPSIRNQASPSSSSEALWGRSFCCSGSREGTKRWGKLGTH